MNLHLYGGVFKNTTRILKETQSIISLGLAKKIVVASVSPDQYGSQLRIDENILVDQFIIFSTKLPKSTIADILKYFEYLVRVFLKYRGTQIANINAHSLNVLVVGVLLKKFGKTDRLIYDPHELETERVGLSGAPRMISKLVEKYLIRFVDHVIVVCDPIRDWYKDTYGLNNISVVRNIPKKQNMHFRNEVLRQKLKIPDNDLVFIYQGVLSQARGVYDMLVAFKTVPSNRHIVFMGFGPAQDDIVSAAEQYSNIHFQPAVAPEEIMAYTSGADVGLHFMSGNLCLSYQLSLPNKFFEYLYAGCSVLVSDNLTYLSELIKSNDLGWSIRPDVDSLASKVLAITVEEIRGRRLRIATYVENNYWELDQMSYKEAFGHV
jgi:glycosyltransferase involved in cell wall biosynthesis